MLFSNKSIEKLNAAFEIYNTQFCDSLPHDYELENITFSESFDSKMQKLLKLEQKPYFYMINTIGKRVAIIILSVLIALTATTFSVKALREAVIDFITETFKTHTKISIDAPQKVNFIATAPQYIPKGYTIEEKIDDCITIYSITYNNEANKPIVYDQIITPATGYSINTEDAECETIYINSFEGMLILKDEYTTVVFSDGEYYYTLIARVPKEELIKMAESIPIPKEGFIKMKPQYIPKDFSVSEENDNEESLRIVYRNSENVPISYSQQINDNSSFTTDTEGTDFETVYINSLEGIKYTNKGFNKIVFGNEQYFFTIDGKVAMKELIKMAESISITQDGFKKLSPMYLPENFVFYNENYTEDVSYLLEYRNNIGNKLRIVQGNNDDSVNVNTENAKVENIYINSLEGIKYKDNNGYNNVVFANEKYHFIITGNIDMKEIIKVAESIPIE